MLKQIEKQSHARRLSVGLFSFQAPWLVLLLLSMKNSNLTLKSVNFTTFWASWRHALSSCTVPTAVVYTETSWGSNPYCSPVRDFTADRKYCGFVRPSYESQTSSYRRRIVLVKTALVTGSMTNDCFVHQQAYLMNDVLPLYPVSTQLGADDAASRYAPHQLASVLTGISARVSTALSSNSSIRAVQSNYSHRALAHNSRRYYWGSIHTVRLCNVLVFVLSFGGYFKLLEYRCLNWANRPGQGKTGRTVGLVWSSTVTPSSNERPMNSFCNSCS